MAKPSIIAAAVLTVALAVGVGVWRTGLERGWFPGQPNSPRAENFERAIGAYLAGTADTFRQRCVSLGYPTGRGEAGFPETQLDWTPAGFLARPLAGDARYSHLPKRLALLARHGLFAETKTDAGPEYTLTWKGYAESNGTGCFYPTDGTRDARVIGFERESTSSGVEIWTAAAQLTPKAPAPWATDPEFDTAFGDRALRTQLDPVYTSFQLARGKDGFTVIAEIGGRTPARAQRSGNDELLAKLAGKVTPERVRALLEAYWARQSSPRNLVCVDLPSRGEADESTLYDGGRRRDQMAPAVLTFYNMPERKNRAGEVMLRGYETMRRLEALGLATSELLDVTEFRGRITQGGVRFTLNESVHARIPSFNRRCLPVGLAKVDAVLRVAQFGAATSRPRFFARARLEPDSAASALLERFPHLERAREPGIAIQGTLHFVRGEIEVSSAQLMLPRFAPDLTQVQLPVIRLDPKARIAPAAAKPRPIGEVVLQVFGGGAKLARGALTMEWCCTAARSSARASHAHGSGRWFAELTLRIPSGRVNPERQTNAGIVADDGDAVRALSAGRGTVAIAGGDSARFRNGDVVGIALDADRRRAWFSLNGVWLRGAPQARGGAALPPGTAWAIAVSAAAVRGAPEGDGWSANFGKRPFKYPIPAGFLSYDGRRTGH